jgi:hypothetical protein
VSTLLSPAPGEFGKPWGKGVLTVTRDAAADDSSKDFTVPAGKIWVLSSAFIDYTCTATVGNRSVSIRFLDGSANVVMRTCVSGAMTASNAYELSLWNTAPLLQTGTQRTMPMAEMRLPAGYVIRVFDSAAIDAAADDMLVTLHLLVFDA